MSPNDPRLAPLKADLREALTQLGVIQKDFPMPRDDELSRHVRDHSDEIESACFEAGADLLLLQTHLKIASLAKNQPGIPSKLWQAAIDSVNPLVRGLRVRVAQIGAPETVEDFLRRVTQALADSNEWLSAAGDLFDESEVIVARVRLTLEADVSLRESTKRSGDWQKITAFTLGGVFVIVLLIVALAVPNPSEFQLFVFRVVLALAAAGVAALIPGFFHIESKAALYTVRAGGALGVFLLVYLVNPPALLHAENRVPIPGDAAWLIAGRLRLNPQTGQHLQNGNRMVWADGPLFVIVSTSDSLSREIPQAGDKVKLLKERLLYIVDYRNAGVTYTHTPPPEKGRLDSSDETGVWLPVGTVLDVREVSDGFYPGEDHSFLWLRVGYPSR